MKILALDLGKYKSVACEYETESGQHSFATICCGTAPTQALHRHRPGVHPSLSPACRAVQCNSVWGVGRGKGH